MFSNLLPEDFYGDSLYNNKSACPTVNLQSLGSKIKEYLRGFRVFFNLDIFSFCDLFELAENIFSTAENIF